MIPAIDQFPRFEKGSPSSEYQQVVNFSVNYLEGMLIGLMHQESVEQESEGEFDGLIPDLQKRMLQRERTIRHAFEFQIEKYFADFKSTSRTRLRLNRNEDNRILGMTNLKSSQINPLIEQLAQACTRQHQEQLDTTSIRLKKMVHRSDGNNDDNPLRPLHLFNAFQAGLDTLGLSVKKNIALLHFFHQVLQAQLENFYQQIDLGLHHLGILPELTDTSLFAAPAAEEPLQPSPLEDETKTTHTEPETSPDDEIREAEPVEEEIVVQEPPQPSRSDETVPTIAQQSLPDERTRVHSLRIKREKKKLEARKLTQLIDQFKFETENGTLNYDRLFAALTKNMLPLLPEKNRDDVSRFNTFYTSLLDNSLISTPLKTQLSRLSCPLLKLVLIDPFFFRSSSHPVNDFLQSIIDFELRFKHQGSSLLFLSRLIDKLLQTENPGLSEFLPQIDHYEEFKQQEELRLQQLQQEQEKKQALLKQQILDITNDITAELVVEQATLQFFYDDWQLLLLRRANQHGVDSAEFQQVLLQAKALCWMLDENKSGDYPALPGGTIKTLLQQVEQGLSEMNFSGEHRSRIRKLLIQEYKNAHRNPHFTYVPSAPAVAGMPIEEDCTLPVDPAQYASDLPALPRRGDWVELLQPGARKPVRAKLQWISADRQHYSFIDHRGHKVRDYNLNEILLALSKGEIKPITRPGLNRSFN